MKTSSKLKAHPLLLLCQIFVVTSTFKCIWVEFQPFATCSQRHWLESTYRYFSTPGFFLVFPKDNEFNNVFAVTVADILLMYLCFLDPWDELCCHITYKAYSGGAVADSSREGDYHQHQKSRLHSKSVCPSQQQDVFSCCCFQLLRWAPQIHRNLFQGIRRCIPHTIHTLCPSWCSSCVTLAEWVFLLLGFPLLKNTVYLL